MVSHTYFYNYRPVSEGWDVSSIAELSLNLCYSHEKVLHEDITLHTWNCCMVICACMENLETIIQLQPMRLWSIHSKEGHTRYSWWILAQLYKILLVILMQILVFTSISIKQIQWRSKFIKLNHSLGRGSHRTFTETWITLDIPNH